MSEASCPIITPLSKNICRPLTSKYSEWTPSRFIRWAEKTGPHTARLVQNIIESRAHPEQAYRSCLGILRLEKHYPKERLENAAGSGAALLLISRSKLCAKSWRTDWIAWKKKTLAHGGAARLTTTSAAASITTERRKLETAEKKRRV